MGEPQQTPMRWGESGWGGLETIGVKLTKKSLYIKDQISDKN